MAIEIERKFLVLSDKLPELKDGIPIKQGYISTTDGINVRVRLAGDKAFLCVKSPARNISRAEYEYEIPPRDGQEMLESVCSLQLVEKHRYHLHHEGLLWEVDIFSGANQGLILAEIELTSEDQSINTPHWIGEEVTLNSRYSNSQLAMIPYCNW
jgi:CYTH domain-containing protein